MKAPSGGKMRVRHYLNGVKTLEEEEGEEREERIIIEVVEDYDINNNFYVRAKIGVASSEEIDVNEIFERLEKIIFEDDCAREEWNILQNVFNVYYDFFGADPSYYFNVHYIGGDFPRREIFIKFF